MTVTSKFRGNDIEFIDGEWYYVDTGEPTIEAWGNKSCANCGEHFTPEGHDNCLGNLRGLMNACCGHGDDKSAYVQFLDGSSVHGEDAVIIQNILKKRKALAEPLCQHKQVTVYERLVSFQTYYEPAEYDFKITCDECDEEFNEIPEGSESKEEPWEDDAPDWDYGL